MNDDYERPAADPDRKAAADPDRKAAADPDRKAAADPDRKAAADSPPAGDAISLDPIGVARTGFSSTDEAPRQGFLDDTEGTVDLVEEYAAGLSGVDAGDRVVVVWYADGSDRVVELSDGRGVFGTRAPARPNPVCITTVEVLAVDEAAGTLRVRGVDMRDGTPVLDIKRTLDPDRAGRERSPGE